MIGGIGIGNIAIVLFVFILLYGGKKLPGLGVGIGKAIKNFKKETKDSAA
ncbi:MAG: twin-arginine translocase TatA/TatE family subunit [Syntrophobacteraceae bacterium]